MKIRFIKLMAVILTLLTFSSVCETSLTVFAYEIRNGENGTEGASDYVEGADPEVDDSAGNEFEAVPYIIGEDESLRTENSKTFRQSDGSFICSVYQEPVHFKNAEGEWEDIDNTLVANESGYKNKSSDFEVVFNSDPEKNDLFTLTYGGSAVSVSLLSEETTDPGQPETTETVSGEAETEYGEAESETDVELLETENETDVGYSEPETDTAPEENDAPEETASASETETGTDPVEPICAREITVLPKNVKETVSPSLLKTAGEIESELLAQDPDVSDEYIKAAVGMQNEINEKQRAERMTPDDLNSSIVYSGLIPGADIRYDLAPQKVKESIIISEPCESCEYSFFIGTSLCARKNGEGEIVFSGDDGEPVFVMPSPFMYDADGNESCDAEYSISETEGGYILSVVASTGWINDAERSFPVVIDPTVVSAKMSGTDWNIITQYVHSLDLNTLHSGEEYWKTGAVRVSNSIAQYYSYMKIQYIPTVPFSCRFISSHLYLPHISYTNGGVSSYNLTVREALANWRSEWTSGATNNNPVIDYITLSNSVAGSYVSMDVTNAVRNWKNGSTNNGLVFTSQKTDGSQMTYSSYANSNFRGYVNNASSDYSTPFLTVEYRNIIGLEGYHTYETAGVDGAGTAYICHYTGDLTFVKDDVAGNGFSVSHVYNSKYCDSYYTSSSVFNTVDYSSMKIGHGWKLNAQQSVVSKTITGVDGYGHSSGIEYLIFSDEDGTEHYFHKDANNSDLFRDEDGLGLTLTRNGNTITMEDEKNNTKVFVYGYLSEIIDRNGNKTVFLYDTTAYTPGGTAWKPKSSASGGYNQLKKIVYVPEGETAITCAVLNYDSSYVLTSITDRSGTVASSFSVGSTGQINSITEYGNRVSYYLYGGGNQRMSMAYDAETKYGVEFGYKQTDGTVNQYKDFTAVNGYGNEKVYYHKIYLNALGNITRARDCGVDLATGGGDDVLSVYVLDRIGRTVTAYSMDPDSKLIGASGAVYTENNGTSKKNNRITRSAETGTVGHNLFLNSGFESGSLGSWAAYTNGSGHYSVVSGAAHRTGNYSVKAYCATFGGYSEVMQTVTLPKTGTYTFSAYVKISSMTVDSALSDRSGVYLSVYKNGQVMAKGDYLKDENGVFGDGWIRVYCVYSGQTGEQLNLYATLSKAKGTVYFDDLQFEYNGLQEGNSVYIQNDCASPYNLLTNSKLFSNGTGAWGNGTNASAAYVEKYSGESGYVIKIDGSPSSASCISQTVTVNLPGTETYMLSGWAKGASVAPRSTSSFQITATVNYSDGTYEYFSAPFSSDVVNTWQYAAKPVIPNRNKTVSTITVTCSYKKNANTAYFDEIALFRESAQAYTYNNDGKVVAVNQTKTDELSNTYSGADLISQTGGASGTVSYQYDADHNVTGVSNGGVNLTLTYDGKGNATSSRLGGTNTSLFMKTEAAYSDYGTKTASVTDNLGNTTSYTYDNSKNRLTSTTSPTSDGGFSVVPSVTTSQSYYASGSNINRPHETYISGKVSLDSQYGRGALSSIVRGGYYNSSVKEKQTYSFARNAYGQITSTSVGGVTLSTNSYDTRGRLVSVTYGNGNIIGYTYDDLDRLTEVSSGGTYENVRYHYDNNSNVSRIDEYADADTLKRAIIFDRDSLGRLVSRRETYENVLTGFVSNSYDEKNRVSGTSYYNGADTVSMSYTYRSTDGALTDYKINGATEVHVNYDGLNRISARNLYQGRSTVFNLQISNTYVPGSAANQTTGLVSQQGYNFVDGEDFELCYEYDNLGNIERISDGNGNTLGEYRYDSQNQLVYEEVWDAGTFVETRAYYYDTYGNIREVRHLSTCSLTDMGEVEMLTPTSVETYAYPALDTSFRDQLTSYNNHTITYDGAGNPLSYYNGSSYTMTWQKGRQLASVTKGGVQTTYTYDSDGIRRSKTVGGSETKYTLAGDKVVGMICTVGGNNYCCSFTYDESGRPYSVTMPGPDPVVPATYYYILNLQGDVIKLVDAGGTAVVNYTYDAWGNILSIKDEDGDAITSATHAGRMNPFRYRGYFYDEETGFYYLKSRYYDPKIRRFINADSLVSTCSGFIGYNMYAYCCNNPVNMDDQNGDLPEWLYKFAIKWVASNIIKPVVKGAEALLSNINATYSRGIALTASSYGVSSSIQGGFSMDTTGTIALQYSTVVGGSSSPGVSLTEYNTLTNAPKIENLQGDGFQLGVSAGAYVEGVPVSAGADINLIPDPNEGKLYKGGTLSGGFGSPGFEAHGEKSNTHTIFKTNIFNTARSIYHLIMEW
ncbi:MAG: carbohydrate binding domain-containing protein [Clostridia bacterium]|nr:carbohydrate binding domain-containing protein [Clostridia bacterium]